MKRWSVVLLLIMAVNMTFVFAEGMGGNNMSDHDFTLMNIAATDALGRKLPEVAGFRKDKYVGIFYFTWLGQQAEPQTEVYDITKLLREDMESLFDIRSRKAPSGFNYFFNEPLFGYYNSADPWVIRKHIEMFVAAGIDFLALDFTNAIVYTKVLPVLLDLLLEYQEAGWKVPQVTFFTNTQSGYVVRTLYNSVYKEEKYASLWFRGNKGKPYIIAWENELTNEMKEFFHVRPPQWPEAEYNELGFPYVEKVRPQRVFTDLVSVSVAQHTGDAFSFSLRGVDGGKKESWGRGYTSKNPRNGDVEAILRGDNFQEQWDVAIGLDPEIVFITGWNEWTALKLTADWAGSTPFWVDTFNTEFSRDIEMTKYPTYVVGENGEYIQEGYGDNFYLQMISNIRRFKGIPLSEGNRYVHVSKTIDITGDLSQWDDIKNRYLNLSTDKIERDHYGYVNVKAYHYTQPAPKNFITDIKVTHDKENIYLLVNTKGKITDFDANSTNWMNLFIGVKGSKAPSWEGFQYVVNRKPVSNTKTTLEKVAENGKHVFTESSRIDYVVKDNTMQIKIPRKDIGIKKDDFTLYFKVADSIEKEDDIMDYYVSGDSVPMGRLVFTYSNGTEGKALKLSMLELVLLLASILLIGACAIVFASHLARRKKG
jgi:hypothetical protein